MSIEEARSRLRSAGWLIRARPFFACLEGAAGSTRAVGGIVRDTLLGIERSTTDIDLATVLLPEDVMRRARAAGLAAHPTGVEHGTVTLVSGGATAEVTTLRQDIQTFGRRAEVRFGTDWKRDAERRDFTMNALYADPDGTLFDPLQGLSDCLARRVRFIGDPDRRIAEDRLRVYRYFRFVAGHGRQQFDSEALEACKRAAQTLDALSEERVGAEMTRLLGLPAIALTLEKMRKADVLAPPLLSDRSLMALARYEQASAEPTLAARLALFAPDATSLDALRSRWRLSNTQVRAAKRLLDARGLAERQEWNALAYYFKADKLEALYAAWALSSRPIDDLETARQHVLALSPPQFPVRGSDLRERGLNGPQLGETLKRLERAWIASGFVLEKQNLLDLT